jgi:hypothetical protein
MIINLIYSEIVYMNIETFYIEKFTLMYQWRGLVLNLRFCEYWSAVLTSRPPGQLADISVRTVLKLFLSCAIGSSLGLMQWLGYLLLLSEVPALSVL